MVRGSSLEEESLKEALADREAQEKGLLDGRRWRDRSTQQGSRVGGRWTSVGSVCLAGSGA